VADAKKLEAVVRELIEIYGVTDPPIPIERMLQHPRADMWIDVDMNDFSSTFLNVSTQFAPRMSLARFLARHIAKSPWGHKRGLTGLDEDDETIHIFARIIAMPVDMVMEINAASRTPQLISLHFEVPEEDAKTRLKEIGAQAGK
jgi:hypothetical protein